MLRWFASAVRQRLRTTDVAARYGGEEVIALLPATDAAGAMVLAERIRLAVGACELAVGELRLRLTVRIGVADVVPGELALDAIIQRADARSGARARG